MTLPYNGVCIFTYGRTGSTLLCEQLVHGIKTKHNINAISLYELLTPHGTFAPNYDHLVVDNTGFLDRPIQDQLGYHRLEGLSNTIEEGVFPVLKLFSTDLTADNRDLINKIILNNPNMYKISLLRHDVVNQFLSWLISVATSVWHHYDGDAKDEVSNFIKKPYVMSRKYAEEQAAGILLQYMWHFEIGYKKCHQTVWYDQLFNTDYPELGLSKSDLIETQTKMNEDHFEAARKCLANFDEMYNIAKRLEDGIKPMLDRLRP